MRAAVWPQESAAVQRAGWGEPATLVSYNNIFTTDTVSHKHLALDHHAHFPKAYVHRVHIPFYLL